MPLPVGRNNALPSAVFVRSALFPVPITFDVVTPGMKYSGT